MKVLLFCSLLFVSQLLTAQDILVVGFGNSSTALQSIIEEEGLNISAKDYPEINERSLADKEIVALFNLRQTWDERPVFDTKQTQELIRFVENGGILYLTSRKSYSNLLVQLGVVLTGNDGGPTGRDWPLILQKTTHFEKHPLTENLMEIQTDVSAKFVVDRNWTILASTEEGTPMLAVRQLGAGQIILGAGERIFRDPRPTRNRYETDIYQGSNYQYHVNLFRYLKAPELQKGAEAQQLPEKEIFKIFPNPTTSSVTITGADINAIDIINVQGQILQQHQFQKENQIILDFEGLSSGLYFLKIQTDQGISVEEVILK